MYNFKEKKLHFNALRNPDAAVYDLELLRQVRPWLPKLRTYARDPKRYASEILYSLLDLTTRENIRAFRRKKSDELKAATEVPGTATGDTPSDETTATDSETSDETTGATDEKTPESAKIETLEQSLEEAEERVEEAEQRAEEAEEAREEAETRAEEAERALDTEKKKEQPKAAPAKSKNTRSTRKSTGTTSSIRKSK